MDLTADIVPVTLKLNTNELGFAFDIDDWDASVSKVGGGGGGASMVGRCSCMMGRACKTGSRGPFQVSNASLHLWNWYRFGSLAMAVFMLRVRRITTTLCIKLNAMV